MALPGEAGGCWAPPGICLGLCLTFEVFLTALGIPGQSCGVRCGFSCWSFSVLQVAYKNGKYCWQSCLCSAPHFPSSWIAKLPVLSTLFQRLWLNSSLSEENTTGEWQLQLNLFLFISCWLDLGQSQTTPYYKVSKSQETWLHVLRPKGKLFHMEDF